MNQYSRNAAQTYANLSSVRIVKTSAVESIHVVPADQSAMTSKETEYKVHAVSNIHHNIPQPVFWDIFLALDLVFLRTQSSSKVTCLTVCYISRVCFFSKRKNSLLP